MGSYVDRLNDFGFVIPNPVDNITTQITSSEKYAADALVSLETAIDNLQNIIGLYSPKYIPPRTDNIPNIGHPDFPTKPDLTIDINDNWPDTDLPEPIIRDTSGVDFNYTEPQPPTPIDSSFDYTPGVYASCLNLCSIISQELVNGGTGLTDAVYALILDRNIEARRSVEDQARRRAQDSVGATGFDLPGGMAAAVVLEIEREVLSKDTDAVNNITIKDFDLADTNSRFIKELALKFEEIQRSTFESEENRAFEIAKVSKELIITIYEQNVKLYIAEWEGVKNKLESAKLQVDAIISQNDSEVKAFLGRAEVLKAQISAIASENESKTEVVKAKAAVYESEVKAYIAEYNALVEEVRIAIEEYKTKVDAAIGMEEVELKAYTSSSALAERAQEAISNVSSQTVASALGMINSSMSFGFSGGESVTKSTSLGNSLSEGHSYEEA